MDYAALAATAARLIAADGAPVTLRGIDTGTYVPGTGQNTQAAPADATLNGALFDFAQGQTNGPGGLIQQGDKRLLMEAGVRVPAMEDRLVVLGTYASGALVAGTGTEYVIKGILEINPAGTPVVYDLHLRT